MKKITFLFLVVIHFSLLHSQEKEIKGFVLHENQPLSIVNISVQNKINKGTTTNSKGYFTINVNKGDILIFKYLGLKTVKIYIEDVTSILNIEMKTDYNLLNEISIKSKSDTGTDEDKPNEVLRLGRSNINVRSSGFGIKYINGKNLNQNALNIVRALQGKAAGLRVVFGRFGEENLFLRGFDKPVIWDVDGNVLFTPPLLNINQVEHIAILSSLGATNAYGADGAGGVVIISTKSDSRRNSGDKFKNNPYTNNEYYNNDAYSYDDIKSGKADYLNIYKDIKEVDVAFSVYKKEYENNVNKNNFHFNIINYFQGKYKDKTTIIKILSDFENYVASNIEDLKGIAYKYQEFGENEKSLRIYKKIAKLRPDYAQSYRDVANAYLDLKDYKNAWKIYKYYFFKGYKIDENDIGEILNSEVANTYLELKKDSTFTDIFELNNSNKILKSDLRFVFEWNTSEAEFIIEFVNANNQVFSIENSIDASNDLILDQKINGYSSKEFMLEKLENTPWLINITYLGNKQYKPTILKLTTYYNWGRKNQTKKMKIFQLKIKNIKTQLLKITEKI